MSAKKLGRFTAGLFVALGLVFGGSLAAAAGGNGAAPAAAKVVTVSAAATQIDYEWG
jgi:hypothetical protein